MKKRLISFCIGAALPPIVVGLFWGAIFIGNRIGIGWFIGIMASLAVGAVFATTEEGDY